MIVLSFDVKSMEEDFSKILLSFDVGIREVSLSVILWSFDAGSWEVDFHDELEFFFCYRTALKSLTFAAERLVRL